MTEKFQMFCPECAEPFIYGYLDPDTGILQKSSDAVKVDVLWYHKECAEINKEEE